MKVKPIFSLVIVVAGLLTLRGIVNSAPGSPGNADAGIGTVAPSSCDDLDAKAKLYRKFLDNYKGNAEQQKVAHDTGKEYIASYGDCPEESDKKVAAYIRRWLTKYESNYTPMPRRVN